MPKKYNLRFAHFADCHLGKKNYGLDQRAEDFADAFKWMCVKAIEEGVDFVLISGDLFDKRKIDSKTLYDAKNALKELKEDNIKVFIIEGNHDRPYYHDRMGWLFYLQLDGLVEQIDVEMYKEYKGCKILSLGYKANIIDKDLDLEFQDDTFNIFMYHAGIEGIIPNMSGCLSKKDLEHLKPYCDYLALGHIHCRYDIDGWIYNPGSSERWNISEWEYQGGCYIVDVDTNTKKFKVEHIPSPKRSMIRLRARIDPKHKDYLIINGDPSYNNESIVEYTLFGETKEKPNIENIKNNLSSSLRDVFYLKIVDKTTRPGSLDTEHITKDRTDIERDVINDMTNDEEMTDLVLEIKKQINDSPEDLLEVIENG